MVVFPPCKINLGLHILRKRTDGYHDIETCFYPLPWTDILEAIPSTAFQFSQTGLSIDTAPEANLCVRAYQLLQHDFDFAPLRLHLHKIVPMGAGLGGGSADAAFTLVLINKVRQLGLSVEHLKDYAARLGSDCAFFIEPRPQLGLGRGEQLHPLPFSLKNFFFVVVKPAVHVSTQDAYAGVTPKIPGKPLADVLGQKVSQWRNSLVNHFEQSIFERYPIIGQVKETMYEQGALYASMSGSGASVFGIFSAKVDLCAAFPGMTCWAGFGQD
ncbi:MAG: 4-(cytidine 5'-diphospho)-2-C-methyl-D-erythritol kinase [Cyclobacteriaceae bacterium]|jgi:4-diphosphocytidyl-2-C-methyl-D-erythritol kinase|nr:4-(cytidine 5'-diphospho)-2-C-methyl-D-erythritol kinase [Flammeovirgaceae bacterium]